MDGFFVKPGGHKSAKVDRNQKRGAAANGSRGGTRGSRRPGRGFRGRGGARGQPPNGLTNGTRMQQSRKRFRPEDEEISSGESEEEQEQQITLQAEHSESEEETEQEKRLRLTKDYLQQLEDQSDIKPVDEKLREEVLEAAGKLRRAIAQQLVQPDVAAEGTLLMLRGHSGHKLSATCVTSDGKFIFSGGKEGSLIKWSMEAKKVLLRILRDKSEALGHSGAITSLSLSSDSKFLASAATDKLIKIWLTAGFELYHTFKGHRDIVSGVAFRMGTHQLFSCSHDRNVKVWNAAEKSYVETLFGHQHAVTGIDSFHKERCVTSGGQDASVRIWKILEESQLVFQLPSGSIDCISLVDDEHFVTGDDGGNVALWGAHKKKPIYTAYAAHKSADGSPCWVTCVDALKNTDVFASGSNSGAIKMWRIQEGYRSISLLFDIPVAGFVNALRIVNDGMTVVAAVGQEHRLGRWWRDSAAKNSVCVISLKRKESVV
ncbi:U3 small nucleolar RNA-interacting protein 2-like [Paramacrobiotus metropolitanus]|uniref:U3 small nucleolar RNA-interacting protein 2-like n=1 Tax=Paramacrobiotus metropolitanus TaxID=2943436 RepID=UPI0024455EDC|nr:U3 small nucleolar RNA-interacting protein 2-like [Paramacrobiotus metropolitanus]